MLNSHDELGMQNTSLSRKPSNLSIPSTTNVWRVSCLTGHIPISWMKFPINMQSSDTACPMINTTCKNSLHLVVACTPFTDHYTYVRVLCKYIAHFIKPNQTPW